MMHQINLNSNDITSILWNKILDNSFNLRQSYLSKFYEQIESLEKLRKDADYNTGTITSSSALLLYSIVLYFKPSVIAEVGSFIGKSTFSMAFAADTYKNNYETIIHTCDNSNDIDFPNLTSTKIIQYKKKSSTEMFSALDKSITIDLIHIDGRLQKEDFPLIKNLLRDETIFVLDDFETVEKGVINYLNFINFKVIDKSSYCLINLVPIDIKKKFNLYGKSTTAFLIPYKFIKFTTQ